MASNTHRHTDTDTHTHTRCNDAPFAALCHFLLQGRPPVTRTDTVTVTVTANTHRRREKRGCRSGNTALPHRNTARTPPQPQRRAKPSLPPPAHTLHPPVHHAHRLFFIARHCVRPSHRAQVKTSTKTTLNGFRGAFTPNVARPAAMPWEPRNPGLPVYLYSESLYKALSLRRLHVAVFRDVVCRMRGEHASRFSQLFWALFCSCVLYVVSAPLSTMPTPVFREWFPCCVFFADVCGSSTLSLSVCVCVSVVHTHTWNVGDSATILLVLGHAVGCHQNRPPGARRVCAGTDGVGDSRCSGDGCVLLCGSGTPPCDAVVVAGCSAHAWFCRGVVVGGSGVASHGAVQRQRRRQRDLRTTRWTERSTTP